jgi:hypothetical protein
MATNKKYAVSDGIQKKVSLPPEEMTINSSSGTKQMTNPFGRSHLTPPP